MGSKEKDGQPLGQNTSSIGVCGFEDWIHGKPDYQRRDCAVREFDGLCSRWSEIDPCSLESVAFTDRATIPRSPGVYFVLSGNEVLYIGKSVNLGQRWATHDKIACFSAMPDIRIAWLNTPANASLLTKFERILIYGHKPSLNLVIHEAEMAGVVGLEHLREVKGVSRIDLACRLGVTTGLVQKWERGEVIPRVTFAQAKIWIDFYDCSLELLAEASKQSKARYESALAGDRA